MGPAGNVPGRDSAWSLAIVGTLFHPDIKPNGYIWISIGLAIGSVVGGSMGLRIPMTAVPQRTALSHSLGALAATLVGIAEYVEHFGAPDYTAGNDDRRSASRWSSAA